MIDDFAAGIDLRKSSLTAPPGTLRQLTNATITAGGEIEKRKTLTSMGALPAGLTHGLAAVGSNLVVFGLDNPAAITPLLPLYVTYQQLNIVTAATIDRILDVQNFGGQVYVVVRFSDASVKHFYGGVLVADVDAQGNAVRAHKTKLYATDGANLRFSGVKTPTQWSTGVGFGIIDVTQEDEGETELVGLEEYFGLLALFGRQSVQIWEMDPDPNVNNLRQVLGNTGLVARNAVARFGSGDVLFLSDTGIRSLRARDIQSAAAVNDIGAPVDELVAVRRAVLTQDDAERLTALVDPLTGHFWLIWNDEALVLTAYPNSKISAWSLFSLGGTVDYAVKIGSRLVLREGDDLLIYGSVAIGNPFDPNTAIGVSDALYDASSVEVITPFMAAGEPATTKTWQGLDATCTGVWDVYVCPNYPAADVPDAEIVWTQIGTLRNSTWDEDRVPVDMSSTHIALRFVSVGAGPATLSSVAIHYQVGQSG